MLCFFAKLQEGKKASSPLLESNAPRMLSLLLVFNGSISAGCACTEEKRRILCVILAVRKALESCLRKWTFLRQKRGLCCSKKRGFKFGRSVLSYSHIY